MQWSLVSTIRNVMNDQSQAPLVPRFSSSDYTDDAIEKRRIWVEARCNANLNLVGESALPAESLSGNIENPIGAVRMPLGVAGPLLVLGEYAEGVFYVPLATTEGALVRSYERGATLITRCGGAQVRLLHDENQISPVLRFASIDEAVTFYRALGPGGELWEGIRKAAESTTSHGKLLAVEPTMAGREVELTLRFQTGDAHGMNMISKAAEAACRWLHEQTAAQGYLIFSGLSSEKRPSGRALTGTKGKHLVAGIEVPERSCRLYLHASPGEIRDLWQRTVIGNILANATGYCGHYANGLTALFIACGQDVANIANSAIGLTNFEVTPEGNLYASVTLPSVTVATVGGGVDLGTSRECLKMLGCHGAGKARKFAEVVAATILSGELSFAAAIASGELSSAHETYGRNRPKEGQS